MKEGRLRTGFGEGDSTGHHEVYVPRFDVDGLTDVGKVREHNEVGGSRA